MTNPIRINDLRAHANADLGTSLIADFQDAPIYGEQMTALPTATVVALLDIAEAAYALVRQLDDLNIAGFEANELRDALARIDFHDTPL